MQGVDNLVCKNISPFRTLNRNLRILGKHKLTSLIHLFLAYTEEHYINKTYL